MAYGLLKMCEEQQLCQALRTKTQTNRYTHLKRFGRPSIKFYSKRATHQNSKNSDGVYAPRLSRQSHPTHEIPYKLTPTSSLSFAISSACCFDTPACVRICSFISSCSLCTAEDSVAEQRISLLSKCKKHVLPPICIV